MATEQRFLTGSKETVPSGDDTAGIVVKDTTEVAVVDSAGNEPLRVLTGTVFLAGLPSVDPGVPGQLYRTAGAVMVSL